MNGIVPGYWTTSGLIHFINQPTRFLRTSGKTGITTHAHTAAYMLVCFCIFCILLHLHFFSLTYTHTYKTLGVWQSHTHWLFPLLFYCLSATCNQSGTYPCCVVLLERESPLCSQPTTKHLPETSISQPAHHRHTHTDTRLHCLSRLL